LIGQLATLGDADTTPPVTAREGGGSSWLRLGTGPDAEGYAGVPALHRRISRD
jgi:hypothetical protein